jgi:periplasmic protein TonB
LRLPLSLLAATALHAAVFGVAAAVLSRPPAEEAAPVAVPLEVEVIAPRPDPVADTAPGLAAPPAKLEASPSRPHGVRHSREVALVDHPAPTLAADRSDIADVADAADAPAVSPAVPPPSPAPTVAVRASKPAAPGGGAVLSAKPRYRTNPKPDYPIPSRRRGEEGIVLLNVVVQPDGTPAAISLNRSCGHPLLDRAALDAVRRWTFEPARTAGVPVSSLVVIPVRFSLDGL